MAGTVVRPGPAGLLPAPGVRVTLHRIAAAGSGPLDSADTRADGRYAFSYRAEAGDSALYIVSATYAGVTYFGSPLREADVRGEAAEVLVYDTTSGPLRLTVRGRHVVVSPGGGAGAERLTVIEVYEVANDSSVTLTGGPSGAATWSAPLPAAAEGFQVGQGDVSPAATAVEGGRVRVFAPFAPGLKQISFSYELPRRAFPLALPMDAASDVVEVLVQSEGARVTGASLAEVDPASVGGRTFRRFLAQDVAAGGEIRIEVPAAAPGRPTRYAPWAGAAAGAAILLALLRALARRPTGRPAAPPSEQAERLARRIAELDDAFAAAATPGAPERAAYVAERAGLKAELVAELAGRGGRV